MSKFLSGFRNKCVAGFRSPARSFLLSSVVNWKRVWLLVLVSYVFLIFVSPVVYYYLT